jgi:hypothetical protein
MMGRGVMANRRRQSLTNVRSEASIMDGKIIYE